jgi:hypothetical protein
LRWILLGRWTITTIQSWCSRLVMFLIFLCWQYPMIGCFSRTW